MPKEKKIKKAVALKYDRLKDEVPKVKASGQGRIAEKIIDLAREHGVPIHDDPDLVEVLASLDVGQEIPSDVYVAVAELLAFVYTSNTDRS